MRHLVITAIGYLVACNVSVPQFTHAADDDGTTDGGTDATAAEMFPSNGSEGPFAPAANTALSSGTHNFTTITVPAGVTVTTTGTGILDLRATGAIDIAGIIDVSGASPTGSGGGFLADPTHLGSDGITAAPPNGVPAQSGSGGGGTTAEIGKAGQGGIGAGGGGMWGGGGGGTYGYQVGSAGGGGGGGPAGGGGGAGIYFTNPTDPCTEELPFTGGNGGGNVLGGTATTPAAGGSSGADPIYDGASGTAGGALSGSCAVEHASGGGGGGAIGRTSAADLAVTDATFVPGSSGGGGGAGSGSNATSGGGGGGAGGAVRLASPISIAIHGAVLARGGAGGKTGGSGGGGGAGGAIYLAAPVLTIDASANVSSAGGLGGIGGFTSNLPYGNGGDGGLGRIRISVSEASCTIDAAIEPPLRSGCAAASASAFAYVAAYPN